MTKEMGKMVGTVRIDGVIDGYSRQPIETVLADADPAAWACEHQPLDAEGRVAFDLGGFLVRSGDRTVLVDVGNGPPREDGLDSGAFLQHLRSLGVEPEDVTDVLLTHLHRDHIGWASRDGEPVFSRATYRAHQADWEHFVSGPDAIRGAQRLLQPVESHLALFAEEREVVPGIVARPAPGHTPGTTIFVVGGPRERVLLMGDAVHTVAELTDVGWESLYDVDRSAARRVRERFAEEAIAHGDLIGAGHFPGLGLGRLVERSGLRRWEPVS